MDDLIEGMISLMDDAHTGEAIVLAKVGQPMSASDALEASSSAAHPRPVECSWPLAAPEALLEPLSPEELASWDASSLPQSPSQP